MSGQNPFEYNGSGIVAMKGKNCIAIGCDTRLEFPKVYKMQDNILMGLVGLATDVQTFHKKIENRQMRAETFASLVGTTLYEHRFGPYLVQPLVVGLDDGVPIIYEYDYIGTQSHSEDFGFIGTAGYNFAGCCESYYKKDLSPEELQDVISNTLVSGIDRDILSGWGGAVYLLTEESLTVQYLKTKMIQFNFRYNNKSPRCYKYPLIVLILLTNRKEVPCLLSQVKQKRIKIILQLVKI